jgi:hypothetical protein
MANKHRGYVEVKLDKKRNLHYDMNALAEIEDALGVQLSELADVKMTIKNIRAILWAGLIHEDPELTPQSVGALVDLENLEEVQEAVTVAFSASQAKNE